MIDPQLQNKVIRVARESVVRSEQIDLKSLWKILDEIDQKEFIKTLQNSDIKYSYGAIPIYENPGIAQSSCSSPGQVTGVDGSQIYPDPFHPVQWAYIQALAYSMYFSPTIEENEFIDFENAESFDFDYREKQNIKRKVDFLRTILELKIALKVHHCHPDHMILMDYPLIPWIDKSDPSYESHTKQYVGMIEQLRGANLAGIVSDPKSQLLLNLMRLSKKIKGEEINIPNLSDSVIACAGLEPGERSAIFTYAGSRNQVFKKYDIEIHFFFIRIKNRDIVRVEIPSWVSCDRDKVDFLHSSILKDSATLGYSYALTMAHNGVVIPLDVAETFHNIATQEYISRGGYFYNSAKTRAKGLATQ